MDNNYTTPIVVSGTADLTKYDPTLVVVLSAPAPEGSVIPVLQADAIIGDFKKVKIKNTYEKDCSRQSGKTQRTSTAVSVLLYVFAFAAVIVMHIMLCLHLAVVA